MFQLLYLDLFLRLNTHELLQRGLVRTLVPVLLQVRFL